MHDGMPYGPIQGQGHGASEVPKIALLVHGQVTIIFVVSVCLFVQSFSQPSLIRFRSN